MQTVFKETQAIISKIKKAYAEHSKEQLSCPKHSRKLFAYISEHIKALHLPEFLNSSRILISINRIPE